MERNPLIDATTRSNGDRVTTESAVLQRYGSAARDVEPCLCLPVSYDPALLESHSRRNHRKRLRLR